MGYFLQAFSLSCKQQLRSWKVWLMALLLPLLILGVKAYLPAEEAAAPVQIGVCLPSDGGEAFWEGLERRSGTIVTFHLTDWHTLEGKVATGQWDCGLVLAEDFAQRLEALDTDAILTLYTSSGSTVYPLVQETAACVLIELLSPGVAQDFARKNDISLEPLLMDTLTAEQQVLIQLKTLSGEALTVETLGQNSSSRLLLGLLALFLLIWVLFSAMDLGRRFASSPAQRMLSVRSPASLLLPQGAAVLLPQLISAAIALMLLDEGWFTLPALAFYLLTLGSAALLLCRWERGRNALPCFMPFITAAALLLSPVVFDLSLLYPGFYAAFSWLPITLFLGACKGSLLSLGLLFLEGLLLLLLFLIAGKK